MEAEAILSIISLCESEQLELLSSEVLVFETNRISNVVRRENVFEILTLAKKVLMVNDEIGNHALDLVSNGIMPIDALHLATASQESADYFCTSDDVLLKKAKKIEGLNTSVVSPLELIEEIEK
ncbi:MAG: PIN domain-containing protein [Candidatus Brocadiales bacterium]|nr:PIN domain-containing protein [Candidatus Brocadiales bacterium]